MISETTTIGETTIAEPKLGESTLAHQPEIADLVPSESSSSPVIESPGAGSFPTVLRGRLDKFFADQRISP
jgi:linoleoyl-CoA desaturase